MKHKSIGHSERELYKALAFCCVLVVFLFSCATIAYSEAGPIVLGTELNGNGSVEYLCLGNGCENLKTMDW